MSCVAMFNVNANVRVAQKPVNSAAFVPLPTYLPNSSPLSLVGISCELGNLDDVLLLLFFSLFLFRNTTSQEPVRLIFVLPATCALFFILAVFMLLNFFCVLHCMLHYYKVMWKVLHWAGWQVSKGCNNICVSSAVKLGKGISCSSNAYFYFVFIIKKLFKSIHELFSIKTHFSTIFKN